MSAGGSRRVRGAACVAGCALLMAACSVSTPRDGFTAVARQGTTPVGQRTGGAGSGTATGSSNGSASAPAGDGTAAGQGSGSGTPVGAGSLTQNAASTRGTGTRSAAAAASSGAAAPAGASGSNRQASVNEAPVVGVTKDSITISAIAGFSGNYGVLLNKIYDNGFGTWVDDVNAHGGIEGRKIVAKKVDNHDTLEGGVAACKEIQNNGSYLAVSIVGFGGADISAADCLDHAAITSIAFNLSGYNTNWRHVYSAGDAGKQTAALATFMRDAIGEHGAIGIIHTNDPVSTTGRAGLVAEMQRQHMNLVHEETVEPNQASYVSELIHMRDSGATTVALVVNTNEMLGILRDARGLGYTPNWTGTIWDSDENAGAARSLLDGIKALRNYSTTDQPAFADYKAKAAATGHNDLVNTGTMALYGMGLVVGSVLQNAGPSPTKEGLGPAIESLVNYNNHITMALSFGPGNHVADVGMWPIQCCNSDNTWRSIGDAKREF